MAKLTEEEAGLLKRLSEKAKAPDAPPTGRSLNISIDLGDDKQVERAQKLGLLDAFGDDDGDGDGDADDDKGGKGGGYFGRAAS